MFYFKLVITSKFWQQLTMFENYFLITQCQKVKIYESQYIFNQIYTKAKLKRTQYFNLKFLLVPFVNHLANILQNRRLKQSQQHTFRWMIGHSLRAILDVEGKNLLMPSVVHLDNLEPAIKTFSSNQLLSFSLQKESIIVTSSFCDQDCWTQSSLVTSQGLPHRGIAIPLWFAMVVVKSQQTSYAAIFLYRTFLRPLFYENALTNFFPAVVRSLYHFFTWDDRRSQCEVSLHFFFPLRVSHYA